MRILLLAGWVLLLPVALAYHMGPGQAQKARDAAAARLKEADRLAATQDYAAAVDEYDAALRFLPHDATTEAQRIRIERAKALMLAHRLPEAQSDLKSLVDTLQDTPNPDPKLLADARRALANAQYYMTWLMRLEGLTRDQWEPEIESARQLHRLLAEQAEAKGDATAALARKQDLESAIRLARMDLSELEGLPLPSQ